MRWFEIALVVLTLLSGLVWLLDNLFLAKRRAANAGLLDEGREPWYVDYAKAFFPVLAIVLVLRSFVAEPFRIPSTLMMPPLPTGAFILAIGRAPCRGRGVPYEWLSLGGGHFKKKTK